MLTPTTREVPPRSIQIRPKEPWGDEDTADIVIEVREKFDIEDNDNLQEGLQEVGGGGAPQEIYPIIQSAAGSAGILILQQIYRYIRDNYTVEDEEDWQDEDGPVIQIDQIYINLSDDRKDPEECRDEMEELIDPDQRSMSNFSKEGEKRNS